MALTIAAIKLAGGVLAISSMPGRAGGYASDLIAILDWRPTLVVSLTEAGESAQAAPALAADLCRNGILWRHFPIADYGIPEAGWLPVSIELHAVLAQGGKVLVHCMGGCGRSGMIALRLMIEAGEAPKSALTRLRAIRPCAVETDAQFAWASQPIQFE
jgi:protein-tyrosine phosphatase